MVCTCLNYLYLQHNPLCQIYTIWYDGHNLCDFCGLSDAWILHEMQSLNAAQWKTRKTQEGSRRNIAITFGIRNGVTTRWWKKIEDMFMHFERDRQTDGRTNGRTPHDGICRPYAQNRATIKLSESGVKVRVGRVSGNINICTVLWDDRSVTASGLFWCTAFLASAFAVLRYARSHSRHRLCRTKFISAYDNSRVRLAHESWHGGAMFVRQQNIQWTGCGSFHA